MKKIFLTLALIFVAISGINAQLLYKISGKGIDKPSYIVGTYHLAPASFADSIPGAKDALGAVEQICGELDMRDIEKSANILIEAMMLPGGISLSDILTKEEMTSLNAYMNGILGADLSNPMLNEQLGKMTPAAITNQLQLVQYMKLTPGFNPTALIDNYFQEEGKKSGKSIIGFETVEFQANILYGTPMQRQKEQMFCMINNQEYNMMLMKKISEAYFAQNLDVILEVTEEKLGNSCDSTPEEENAMIYDRNSDWVNKIPAIANEKATLFVVGAAHLPGERGVLELLRKEGYAVEAVL